MNKSLAFATASHYVRAALAGITSLIEIFYNEVAPSSELETNLRQMDSCTKDLLGILNSILDTSQIEAGKMQLEEEEFEVAQLLEDVVDLYHPVGLRKGIDVALGPYDCSVIKFSRGKGREFLRKSKYQYLKTRSKSKKQLLEKEVRLMHGEIRIVDKEIGERGTCFRFNVLLAVSTASTHTPSTSGVSIHAPSPRLNIQIPSPRIEGSGSFVVLLIKNEENGRISQKFLENLEIKVLVAEH
ncbi:hypothetical protein L3X38_045512 [Prunus dulcis]|uniref:histidine kinase n=1 Tax=Prunus dulcis TaxID=3755 RepID=A0AAD4UPE7_PRUDU|nr:hypothetical protein L3X38_045512 [Prunus dulcis]